MRQYSELADGRFAVIADFEDPRHFQIVQLLGTTDVARRALDSRRGRSETGGACLLFTTGSPNDAIVISNRAATDWYLKQDWRPYDLLLVSVYAPRSGLTINLGVSGGAPAARLAAQTFATLDEGWNLLRFDVGEIGEHLPLDDIQEVRLSVSGSSAPIEVAIDDVLLTSFRKRIVGTDGAGADGLFVEQVGRRWRIGRTPQDGGFVLVFSSGQIVGWYDLQSDPYQVNNLLAGTALGPMPATINGGRITPLAATFPPPLSVHSRVLEANPVRVVIASEWASAGGSRGPSGWIEALYTIYASGQIYISAASALTTDAESQADEAWVFFLPDGWQVEVTAAGQSIAGQDPSEERPADQASAPYAVARPANGHASLLVIPGHPGADMKVIRPEAPSAEDRETRTALVARANPSGGAGRTDRDARRSMKWHLYVQGGEIQPREAADRAAGYVEPSAARLDVGRLHDAGQGAAATSGFDASLGCFLSQADGGVARFIIDGRHGPLFSPAFAVAGPPGRDSWVYVDHRLLGRTARDAGGAVLFQLAEPVRDRTLVEVLFATTP